VHFLVDASLPRGAAVLLRSRGHHATDVRDLGLRGARDQDIATHAQAGQLALISRDFDFADVRNYPPQEYPGLVVLGLPNHATVSVILKLIDVFLGQRDVLRDLPGRLAIVEPGRIRLRPAP